ncbi:MAG: DUF7536 family protein [Halobacteriota archaeon]
MTVEPLRRLVTDEVPDRPSPGRLLSALDVRRNVTVGVAVGVLLAVVVYAFRVFEVVGPFAGTREYPVLGPEVWFLLLAFVLASTTALLVATALTLVSVHRLTRRL